MESSNTPLVLIVLALISSGPNLIQAFYAALSYHRPPGAPVVKPPALDGKWRFWIATIFPILAWCAVGFDYYDRHYNTPIFAPMVGWGTSTAPGASTPVYTVALATQPIFPFRGKQKLMLLVRNNWATADRETDTAIEKSGLYTIDGNVVNMQIVGSGVIKFAAGQINTVEFYAVMLPNDVTPEQVTRIADIAKLGGKIVSSNGQGVVGGGAPIGAPLVPQSPPSTGSGTPP